MLKNRKFGCNWEKVKGVFLVFGLPMAGLGMSAFSATGICTGGCSALTDYRLFGTSFSVGGIAFFSLIIASIYVTQRLGRFHWIVDLLVIAGLGAELYFLLIQKFMVKKWCPICLTIASMLLLFLVVRRISSGFRKTEDPAPTISHRKWFLMQTGKIITVVVALVVGFMVAIVSVGKKDVALGSQGKALEAAAETGMKTIARSLSDADIWFGKNGSQIEVYFVSDWYCSFCRKAEPVIEGTLPELGQHARYTWIDMPVHRQSLSLVPFGLNVLVHDKGNYLRARRLLLNLSQERKAVPEEMVRKAFMAKGLSVPAEQEKGNLSLLFTDAVTFCRTSKVDQTPSVIVVDRGTGNRQVLSGVDQITRENLLAAVKGSAK